jgi:hypothetical protein
VGRRLRLHRRYRRDGTWPAIPPRIVAYAQETGEIDWFVPVNSTTVRAHQHACGAAADGAAPRAAPMTSTGFALAPAVV